MFCHKVLITCSRRDYLTKPYFRHTAGAMLLKARNAWLSAVLHLVGLSLFLGRTRKKVCNCACLDKFSLSWNWETATIWFSCLGTLLTGNFYRYLSVGIWHYQGWWLGPYWHDLKWDSRALFFSSSWLDVNGERGFILFREGSTGMILYFPCCFNFRATSVAHCTRKAIVL